MADVMRTSAPIRRKLSTISLVSTGAALLLITAAFLVGEVFAARAASLQQLRTLSQAIATNSTAALAFDNPDDARAVLGAFRSDPHFVAAALYKEDGQRFATFPEPAPPGALPESAGGLGFHISGAALIGVVAVREGSRTLGTGWGKISAKKGWSSSWDGFPIGSAPMRP